MSACAVAVEGLPRAALEDEPVVAVVERRDDAVEGVADRPGRGRRLVGSGDSSMSASSPSMVAQPLVDGVAEEAALGGVDAVLRRRPAARSRSPRPARARAGGCRARRRRRRRARSARPARGTARRTSRRAWCRRTRRGRSASPRRARPAARPCRGRPRWWSRGRPASPRGSAQPAPKARTSAAYCCSSAASSGSGSPAR